MEVRGLIVMFLKPAVVIESRVVALASVIWTRGVKHAHGVAYTRESSASPFIHSILLSNHL